MIERRYQVFISSTFRDLVAERQAVLLAIQKLNHLPAGMELFPSANDTPWDIIERIIALSDYYVLIVGGRYGSTDEDGVSFTEREYELARSKDIPVLAFLHADPGKLPAEHFEIDAAARTRLEAFRDKVQQKHYLNQWRTPHDLATSVVVSLANEIAKNPRPGWVRGDQVNDQQELLLTLETIRRENDSLRASLDRMRDDGFGLDGDEGISQGNDPLVLTLHRRVEEEKSTRIESDDISTTWHDVFMAFAWDATSGATDSSLMHSIAKKFGEHYFLRDETWQRIATQFMALDLIAARQELRPVSSFALAMNKNLSSQTPTDIWYLTERGRRLFAHANAIRRNQR